MAINSTNAIPVDVYVIDTIAAVELIWQRVAAGKNTEFKKNAFQGNGSTKLYAHLQQGKCMLEGTSLLRQ